MSLLGQPPAKSQGGFLVWHSGPLGPRPQWWAELDFDDRPGAQGRVVAAHPLTREEALLPLDELAVRYPLLKGGRRR